MRTQSLGHSSVVAVSLCVLSLLVFCPGTAQAETYIGGQLGFTIPEGFSSVTNDGGGFRFDNLDLNNSFTYGAKAGHYFEQYKWLGVETDLYTTTPHLEGQTVNRTDGGVTSVSVPGALTRVTTWAFSVMVRHPGEKFQPYAGAGIGLNFAKATGVLHAGQRHKPGVSPGRRLAVLCHKGSGALRRV